MAWHGVCAVFIDPKHWRMFDDTLPTLEALFRQRWAHLVLSNHVPELGALVAHLGLDTHIRRVFNSAETGYEKPHPLAYQSVLDYIRSEGGAEAVWMIGDSMAADVVGAEAAGIPAILIRRHHPETVRFCADLVRVRAVAGHEREGAVSEDGQELTRAVYEDAGVVSEFAARPRASAQRLDAFARSLRGDRIIDLGCGPGHDAFHFASLGRRVTAVDYSEAMIQEARGRLAQFPIGGGDPPTFLVLDMRDIGGAFPADSFDGAWVSASLLHVPEAEVPAVLGGVRRILAPGGKSHISLKAGSQGAALVREHKYGREIEREFVFWEEETFEALLRGAGFRDISCGRGIGGTTGREPTEWLWFTAETNK